MKLWLDDVRPAPDRSWVWTKTVDETIALLTAWGSTMTVASLDHDLGEVADPNWNGDPREPQELTWEDYHRARSAPGADGIDLVHWMVEHSVYPSEEIVIHSWNPAGARNMYRALVSVCPVPIIIRPFEIPEHLKPTYMKVEHPDYATNARRFNE